MGDKFVPRGTNFVPGEKFVPRRTNLSPMAEFCPGPTQRLREATSGVKIVPFCIPNGFGVKKLLGVWLEHHISQISAGDKFVPRGTNLSPKREFCPLIFQWFRGAISTSEIVPFYLPNGFVVRKLWTWDQFCVPGDKICPLEDKICPPGDKFVPRIFDRKSAYPVTKLHFWSKCDQNDNKQWKFQDFFCHANFQIFD